MRIDVVTIFPEMFDSPMKASILRLAREREIVTVAVHDLRDYASGKHKQVDDEPYGGGPGMVMKPEPFFAAVEDLAHRFGVPDEVIVMSPRGRKLNQAILAELATAEHLVILCGRYEGIDQRVCDHLATQEISVGDYVLTGGEIPSMIVIDGVVRLLAGALGDSESVQDESFSDGLLEYPHYTRPARFRDWEVPDVLVSGNHADIDRWRRAQAEAITARRRPDLLDPRKG